VSPWLPYAAIGLFVLLVQVLAAGIVFVLLVLAGRAGATFIPLRDYRWFVARLTPLRGGLEAKESSAPHGGSQRE
jgi:hypothetical protein